jgi:hypothetical protein
VAAGARLECRSRLGYGWTGEDDASESDEPHLPPRRQRQQRQQRHEEAEKVQKVPGVFRMGGTRTT